MAAFAMQLSHFTPGAKLEIVNASFRGIGFGGQATVVKYEPDAFELDLRVTKLLFHIDVVLRFRGDADGSVDFWGGRPDGKQTGKEPAHVKHTMTVRHQTADGSVFEFGMIENDVPVIKQVGVEKTSFNGVEAVRITYDRIELTLAPRR